jgi:hypothetical protein
LAKDGAKIKACFSKEVIVQNKAFSLAGVSIALQGNDFRKMGHSIVVVSTYMN